MSGLQSLRNAHGLARFVLVWLALFIGAAVASPLIKTEATQLVCSATLGMKMVKVAADDGPQASPAAHGSLDCPACLPLVAPPVLAAPVALPPGGLAHVLLPLPLARLASLLGQPWQARAPPVSFA